MCYKLLLLTLLEISLSYPNGYADYQYIFNPENYMEHLPSLSMPYINNIQIPTPNVQAINPSPVMTKVINVVTRYVNKNPMCIKVTKKKPACPYKNSKNNMEYLVTKEYYVKDQTSKNRKETNKRLRKKNKRKKIKRRKPAANVYEDTFKKTNISRENDDDDDEITFDIESSESGRVLTQIYPTPVLNLSNTKVKEILIEDRLDHLEEILPHYKRKRIYQTSTITVTKVRYYNKATATLLVKNCVPPDIPVCPKRRRKTKDIRISSIEENHFDDY